MIIVTLILKVNNSIAIPLLWLHDVQYPLWTGQVCTVWGQWIPFVPGSTSTSPSPVQQPKPAAPESPDQTPGSSLPQPRYLGRSRCPLDRYSPDHFEHSVLAGNYGNSHLFHTSVWCKRGSSAHIVNGFSWPPKSASQLPLQFFAKSRHNGFPRPMAMTLSCSGLQHAYASLASSDQAKSPYHQHKLSLALDSSKLGGCCSGQHRQSLCLTGTPQMIQVRPIC